MAEHTDEFYMRRALSLAQRGKGRTSPNPTVGAVVVRRGVIVGEGYHRGPGRDHAERVALRKAGAKAQGGTLYVNLEPCCHTGRTGPCTETIVQAGIFRVVYSVRDSDRRVMGKGARQLQRAGVRVERGLLKQAAVALNEGYFHYHRYGRPLVILKMAQTLDGRIATVGGDSKWISGKESLRLAHRLRAEADAVMVGMGTVRNDNPALTVRRVRGENPYRIILSASLRFPRRCGLLDDIDDGKTIVAANRRLLQKSAITNRCRRANLIWWGLSADRNGLVDLHELLAHCGEFGMRSLLVEGGNRLATSFLKAGLVDKCVLITAPIVVGDGISAVGDMGVKKLAEAVAFERCSFEKCGRDYVFVGYPKRKVD
ncbi:MAG: bifunctional diaminohydroxyphosphoribosylaminopyrimidine deaminase/5-amino-6-(5-phosphoribosylamino)uracil reductase RibD [bacterium]